MAQDNPPAIVSSKSTQFGTLARVLPAVSSHCSQYITRPTTKPPATIICLFGITGSGKSSFINDASGDKLAVGHSQMSCTSEVVSSRKFSLDGKSIRLIDTPGFDDTLKSDTEILRMINNFLANTYNGGRLITGMIYLHRITDVRFGGVSRRNFRVFQELCGRDALQNLIICTNFWPNSSSEVYEAREEELISTPEFFQAAIAMGARIVRYTDRGQRQAHEIIRMCLNNQAKPVQIQVETANGATLIETSAGRALKGELEAILNNQLGRLAETAEDHEAALRRKDEETCQELLEVQTEQEQLIQRLLRNMERLETGFVTSGRKYQAEQEKPVPQAIAQRKQELQDLTQQYEKLQAELRRANALVTQLQQKSGVVLAEINKKGKSIEALTAAVLKRSS